jgi:hypothetical protein
VVQKILLITSVFGRDIIFNILVKLGNVALASLAYGAKAPPPNFYEFLENPFACLTHSSLSTFLGKSI